MLWTSRIFAVLLFLFSLLILLGSLIGLSSDTLVDPATSAAMLLASLSLAVLIWRRPIRRPKQAALVVLGSLVGVLGAISVGLEFDAMLGYPSDEPGAGWPLSLLFLLIGGVLLVLGFRGSSAGSRTVEDKAANAGGTVAEAGDPAVFREFGPASIVLAADCLPGGICGILSAYPVQPLRKTASRPVPQPMEDPT